MPWFSPIVFRLCEKGGSRIVVCTRVFTACRDLKGLVKGGIVIYHGVKKCWLSLCYFRNNPFTRQQRIQVRGQKACLSEDSIYFILQSSIIDSSFKVF